MPLPRPLSLYTKPDRRWILPAAAAGPYGYSSSPDCWRDRQYWKYSGVVHECVGACQTSVSTRRCRFIEFLRRTTLVIVYGENNVGFESVNGGGLL
jgi:hypothetical protein